MLLTSIYALSIYILVSGQAPPCLLITFLYHFFSRLATPGCHRSSLSNLGWFLITICELDFELKLKFDWPPNLKAGKFGDIRFERRLQSCNPSFFCISFTWSIQIAGRSKWSKNSDRLRGQLVGLAMCTLPCALLRGKPHGWMSGGCFSTDSTHWALSAI